MNKRFSLLVLVFLYLPALARTGLCQTNPSQLDTVKMVGASLGMSLMDDLTAEYRRNRHSVALEFLRNDTHSGAAAALLQDRDLMVSLGPVTNKTLGSVAERWSQYKPSCSVLGGRALAIVVHVNNPLDSLTLEQIQSVFSGQTTQWKILGGPDKAIRCYGPDLPDSYARMFSNKVLPQHRWGTIFKKKKSQDVLKSLAADPTGIAFVNASGTVAFGESVKVLGVGPGDKAVYLNTQTLKDGSYPFCEVLMLYSSPKAGDTARDFAAYATSGDCDAVYLRSDFMPGLRSIRADVLATFVQLYGASIAKAKETLEEDDDLVLAKQILAAAKSTQSLDPDLKVMMITGVYDLCHKHRNGQELATEAMKYMAEAYPERKLECCQKLAAMHEVSYSANGTNEEGEDLIDVWMNCVELALLSRQHKDAAAACQRALEVALSIHSEKAEYVKARWGPILAREQALKEIDELRETLRSAPDNREVREKLVRLYLIERDSPAEAAKFLGSSSDPTFRTNVPLSLAKMETLSKEAVLKLAEWYLNLADEAGPGGKEMMLRRAREYYVRFLSLYAVKDDLAVRAELGYKKAGQMLRQISPDSPIADMPIEVIGEGGWSDLLSRVDLKRDLRKGKCERKGKFLQIIQNGTILSLPATCEGDYEMTVGFVFEKGADLGVILPVGSAKTGFNLGITGKDKKKYSGIALLGNTYNVDKEKQALVPVGDLADGREHCMVVKVAAKNGILDLTVRMDNKPYYAWKGPAETAGVPDYWSTKRPKAPGIATWGSLLTLTKIQVRGPKVETMAIPFGND